MTENLIIRCERSSEEQPVEALVRDAFWNIYRPGAWEHCVLHRMRSDPAFIKELNLVAELDGKLIGQVAFLKSTLTTGDGSPLDVITFGPICIHPSLQGRGYGLRLLNYALEKAHSLGYGAVMTEGNPAFYGKAGFSAGKSQGIVYADDPDADYFLVRELIPGCLDGITGSYRDPSVYFVTQLEVDCFDAQFEPREKLKLPGQIFQ